MLGRCCDTFGADINALLLTERDNPFASTTADRLSSPTENCRPDPETEKLVMVFHDSREKIAVIIIIIGWRIYTYYPLQTKPLFSTTFADDNLLLEGFPLPFRLAFPKGKRPESPRVGACQSHRVPCTTSPIILRAMSIRPRANLRLRPASSTTMTSPSRTRSKTPFRLRWNLLLSRRIFFNASSNTERTTLLRSLLSAELKLEIRLKPDI